MTVSPPLHCSFPSHSVLYLILNQQHRCPCALGNVSTVDHEFIPCALLGPNLPLPIWPRQQPRKHTEPSTVKADPGGLEHRRTWKFNGPKHLEPLCSSPSPAVLLFSVTGETLCMFLSPDRFYMLSLKHRQYP
jgi:hypothetical protein